MLRELVPVPILLVVLVLTTTGTGSNLQQAWLLYTTELVLEVLEV
jgi:hypothetical protein